jgi:thiol-disulfide isomerase/thioredoxin
MSDIALQPHVQLTRRQALTALAASMVVASAEAGEASQRREWPRGRPTPALDLAGTGGARWRLADARGKVVLLNFWASWCTPCRVEMPSLELLAQRHERDGLLVMAVNYRETDAAVRRFLSEMPLTLDILRDTDGGAARDWGVRIFPSTIAIGRDGKAAFTVTGELDWAGPVAREWLAPMF